MYFETGNAQTQLVGNSGRHDIPVTTSQTFLPGCLASLRLRKKEKDREILARLGSEAALNDLDAKMRRTAPSQRNPATQDDDPLRGRAVIEEIIKKQQVEQERLAKIPFIRLTFPHRELITLSSLWQHIKTAVVANHQKSNEARLAELERRLDVLRLWQSKFSTMPGSGIGDALERDTAIDSVYYVTPSGISLRLRKVSLEEGRGLAEVALPYQERIIFASDTDRSQTLHPNLGKWVNEYSTRSFQRIFDQPIINADYQSKIHLHQTGRAVAGLSAPDREWLEAHTGDRINHLYFER